MTIVKIQMDGEVVKTKPSKWYLVVKFQRQARYYTFNTIGDELLLNFGAKFQR